MIVNNKCIIIVKFQDNVRFNLDSDSIKTVILNKYNDKDVNTFKVSGNLFDPDTGISHNISFLLIFSGFFRQTLQGRLWVPTGVHAKDYDMFTRLKPYVLSFQIDALETFQPRFSTRPVPTKGQDSDLLGQIGNEEGYIND